MPLQDRACARLDAPEVDGVVIVNQELPLGEFARVKITQASEYDLMATPVST